mmetsp:Transcript_11115/g.19018  ORF Transcript_11115/g.19018 Transcript_11115/m.19018 type:complete len:219 (-) Transcript_11115:131-787(-)|eukprot:CAMPEP_0184702478 /NCGR_PEP_ID=MMETSP0313-20130426/24360_1 /TAXON_ID=2792 /ORGANISM="Porphyridium aerugineum, Strain SAG 1380-2" /LENGTH=218 /DNA_ID=CAMNT_0027162955 /DNA_START=101 /DNA_END=757 /DNA_ORIENTATION=-
MALREFPSQALSKYLNSCRNVFHQPSFSAATSALGKLHNVGRPLFLLRASRHLSSVPPSLPPTDPSDNHDVEQPRTPEEEDITTKQGNQTHQPQTSLHREADAQRRRMHEHEQRLANREHYMTMKYLAQLATQSMFPWERAHMDGDASKKPLNIYEKVYWILFGLVAVPGLMYELCYPQLMYGRDIVRTLFDGQKKKDRRVIEDDVEVLVSSCDQGSQ